MSDVAPQEGGKKHVLDWPWTVIVSVVGLVWLGIAYSLGDAYYGAYLRAFSIDDGGFPLDRPKHLVLAVWGALHASIALQNWMQSSWRELVIFSVVMIGYIGLMFVGAKVITWMSSRSSTPRGRVQQWLQSHPSVRKYLGVIIATVLVALGFIWFCVFVPVFISIPSGIGAAAGESIAKQDKKDFEKGCARSAAMCYAAFRDGKEVARGYAIAQSTGRVALYYQGSTTQIPLVGIQLQTIGQGGK